MKLAIRNFQLIVKSNIDLNGIVCLVASNNEGKTAHIRALRALITNSSNKDQIRVGSSEFIVGLQLDNMEIHYKRGKTVQYHVNGEDYTKIGRDSLDKVFQGSGLLYDRESDFPVLPQFIFQKETPFPFNLTPSKMYSQFSKFFGVDKLEVVMKSVAEDLRAEKGELKYKQGQHDSLSITVEVQKEKLAKMPTVEQIEELRGKILVIETRVELINRVKSLIEQGRAIQLRLGETKIGIEKHKQILTKLIPVVSKYEGILGKITLISGFKDQIETLKSRYNVVFNKLDKLRVLDYENCYKKIDKYVIWLGYKNTLEKLSGLELVVQEDMIEASRDLDIQQTSLSKFKACPLCEAPVKNGKYINLN